mmetsp:Transcript_8570/g.26797  ORF Transcript_8570/g.26797 Transcript_8570/m.26797 type:complete len:209 (-) Transcript_8570:40-666(-)
MSVRHAIAAMLFARTAALVAKPTLRIAARARPSTRLMMSEAPAADFSRIDLRVGSIVDAYDHPESDKLIIEEIDLGEPDGPRQIVSGLRAHYAAKDLVGKKVLVVANLPTAKLGGVPSAGMVLCGSKDDKAVVEVVEPPADADEGERAFVDGVDGDAATPNQVKKKKLWPPVADGLKMVGGVATFGGDVISTSEGPCTCATIADGDIS